MGRFCTYSFLGLFLTVLTIACSKKSAEQEIMHVVEVKPSEVIVFYDTAAILDIPEPGKLEISEAYSLKPFYSLYETVYDTTEKFGNILLERFVSGRIQKICLSRKVPIHINDSMVTTPKAVMWKFTYQDTLALKNVMRNWFLEFGDNRKEISIGYTGNVSSMPLLSIVKAKEIYILGLSCIETNLSFWANMRSNFLNAFKSDASMIFEVDCDEHLDWIKTD